MAPPPQPPLRPAAAAAVEEEEEEEESRPSASNPGLCYAAGDGQTNKLSSFRVRKVRIPVPVLSSWPGISRLPPPVRTSSKRAASFPFLVGERSSEFGAVGKRMSRIYVVRVKRWIGGTVSQVLRHHAKICSISGVSEVIRCFFEARTASGKWLLATGKHSASSPLSHSLLALSLGV
ncbi:hypothetical protein PG990_014550 [Apiospora arundinis]